MNYNAHNFTAFDSDVSGGGWSLVDSLILLASLVGRPVLFLFFWLPRRERSTRARHA